MTGANLVCDNTCIVNTLIVNANVTFKAISICVSTIHFWSGDSIYKLKYNK